MKRVMILIIGFIILTVSILAALLYGSGLYMFKPPQSCEDVLPAQRTNEQMLEFILTSVRENIGIQDIGYIEYKGYSLANTTPWVLTIGQEEIYVYACADHLEKRRVEDHRCSIASTEFRAWPVTQVEYGNVILIYYGENQKIIKLVESLVVDTRKAALDVKRWQKWLTKRGIASQIESDGFSCTNPYTYYMLNGCQSLFLTIENQGVWVVCFAGPASATQFVKSLYHAYSVMDIGVNKIRYDAYGPYENMVIGTECSTQIEPLIKEFWSKNLLFH